jgi:hypothetical protein
VKEFSVKAEETRCNYAYYAEGFGESRCLGKTCEQPGEACLSCRSGACPPGANPSSYACVKASWAGNIVFSDQRYVENMIPIVVCGDARKPAALADPSKAMEAMFEVGSAKKPELKGAEGEQGNQSYTFDLDDDGINEAEKKCATRGGVVGFLIGIQYNDGSTLGGLLQFVDDIAIVSKKNCGSGAVLSGYADGTNNSFDVTDMKRALYCGLIVPTPPALKAQDVYWSAEELRAAAGLTDHPKPIICDLQLNNTNAPDDPVKKAPTTFSSQVGDVKCRG